MSKISDVPQIRFKGFTDAWEQHKLGEAINVKSGKDYKHLDNGDVPVYGTGGYMLSVSEALEYSRDAIGIGRKGTIDKPFVLKAPFWTVDTLFYCIPEGDNALSFLYPLFQLINWKLYDESTGVPSLSKTAIEGVTINLTSEDEQISIGEFFERVDNLITLHKRKYDQVVNFKKAMLEKMFPKDGSDIPEIRFKEFSGQKSDCWEVAKLSEIASVIDPHPSHRAPDVVYAGIPFIGIGDVDETGEIDCSSARTVHERIFEEHKKRYDLSIPSIGIGRVASLGKVIRLRNDIGKYAVSPTMAIIQFSQNVDNNYMYYFMCTTSFQKQFSSQGNGSTRQSVGIQDLRELIVLLPKKNREQETIGKYFNCLDNLCILHQRKLQKLKNIKKAMLEKMFV